MKKNFKKYCLFIVIISTAFQLYAQTIKPDLQDISRWDIINRKAEAVNEDGKKAARFNEAPNEGLLVLKGIEFANGTIEFDVKGRNVIQQSFVGIAFHGLNDSTYDGVYFRPFNFQSGESTRRHHSVQYISPPKYDWAVLRETHPGKYENALVTAIDPESWFHAKIIIKADSIAVYVNDDKKASLTIQQISNRTTGKIGFWVGNNSDGDFKNLSIQTK